MVLVLVHICGVDDRALRPRGGECDEHGPQIFGVDIVHQDTTRLRVLDRGERLDIPIRDVPEQRTGRRPFQPRPGQQAHDLGPYLRTLALDGNLCTLGYLGPQTVDVMDLLIGRKRLSSAGSGGRRHTQDMLDFCAEHAIVPDVEVLPSTQVNEALDRLSRGDVRYRFVLDMADLAN